MLCLPGSTSPPSGVKPLTLGHRRQASAVPSKMANVMAVSVTTVFFVAFIAILVWVYVASARRFCGFASSSSGLSYVKTLPSGKSKIKAVYFSHYFWFRSPRVLCSRLIYNDLRLLSERLVLRQKMSILEPVRATFGLARCFCPEKMRQPLARFKNLP